MSGTVKERILAHIQAGNTLTQSEALRLFNTSRLAAAIFALRQAGHDIRAEMIEVATGDGRSVRVARYSLRPKAPGELFPAAPRGVTREFDH